MAIPPLPMHFTQFLRHGGAGVGTVIVRGGHVVALSDEAIFGLLQWAIEEGPAAAAERGATIPLPPELHPILKAVSAMPKPQAPDLSRRSRRGTWREGLERIRRGENLSHPDRFRLLMSLLRAGWDDEAIQEAYSHAPNYDRKVTQGHINHARRRYMG